MTYTIEMKDRPAQRTLAIRTHSPVQDLPVVIPQTMQKIGDYLAQTKQSTNDIPFVGYYNMDMQNLDVEIGFLSSGNASGQGSIQTGTIPAGKAATVMHIGSYATIGNAHEFLHKWMEANGYQSVNGYYEIYLNDPADTPEDQLKTEIFTLVKTS